MDTEPMQFKQDKRELSIPKPDNVPPDWKGLAQSRFRRVNELLEKLKEATDAFNALHGERNGLAQQNIAFRTDNLRLRGELRQVTAQRDEAQRHANSNAQAYQEKYAQCERALQEMGEQMVLADQYKAQRDELLAALRRAGMDLQDIKTDCDSGEFEIDPQFAIDRIQAAITKATER